MKSSRTRCRVFLAIPWSCFDQPGPRDRPRCAMTTLFSLRRKRLRTEGSLSRSIPLMRCPYQRSHRWTHCKWKMRVLKPVLAESSCPIANASSPSHCFLCCHSAYHARPLYDLLLEDLGPLLCQYCRHCCSTISKAVPSLLSVLCCLKLCLSTFSSFCPSFRRVACLTRLR